MGIIELLLLPFAAVAVVIWVLVWRRVRRRLPQPSDQERTHQPMWSRAAQTSSAHGAPDSDTGIFISYRRDDEPHLAGRLNDRIASEFGRDKVFMDVDSIEPGLDFTEVINSALEKCQVLLVLIGAGWLSASDMRGNRRLDNPDDYVRFEIEAALSKGVRVIPVLVEGTMMPGSEELPGHLGGLARRNAVHVSHERFNSDVSRVVEVLRRIVI